MKTQHQKCTHVINVTFYMDTIGALEHITDDFCEATEIGLQPRVLHYPSSTVLEFKHKHCIIEVKFVGELPQAVKSTWLKSYGFIPKSEISFSTYEYSEAFYDTVIMLTARFIKSRRLAPFILKEVETDTDFMVNSKGQIIVNSKAPMWTHERLSVLKNLALSFELT